MKTWWENARYSWCLVHCSAHDNLSLYPLTFSFAWGLERYSGNNKTRLSRLLILDHSSDIFQFWWRQFWSCFILTVLIDKLTAVSKAPLTLVFRVLVWQLLCLMSACIAGLYIKNKIDVQAISIMTSWMLSSTNASWKWHEWSLILHRPQYKSMENGKYLLNWYILVSFLALQCHRIKALIKCHPVIRLYFFHDLWDIWYSLQLKHNLAIW